jgi:hypothetical protein
LCNFLFFNSDWFWDHFLLLLRLCICDLIRERPILEAICDFVFSQVTDLSFGCLLIFREDSTDQPFSDKQELVYC